MDTKGGKSRGDGGGGGMNWVIGIDMYTHVHMYTLPNVKQFTLCKTQM